MNVSATAQENTSLSMCRSDNQKTCSAKLIAAQTSMAIHASVINTPNAINKR
jgi:hypothetical protein